MIDAFVDGRLSAADHDLMVHHISSCTECAAAVIAALAEAARALAAEANERPAAWTSSNGAHTTAVTDAGLPPMEPPDLLQLDFTLDHTTEPVDLLLPRETVQEVQLDDLYPPSEEFRSADEPVVADAIALVQEEPAISQALEVDEVAAATEASDREFVVTASVESVSRAEPENAAEPQNASEAESATELVSPAEPGSAAAEPDAEVVSQADTLADIAGADEDGEIETATAAGVAASVAHAAAALAEDAWEDAAPEPVLADAQVRALPEAVDEGPPAPPDERIPDDARAAIVSSIHADADAGAAALPRRSGWSAAAIAIVALMVFAGLGAYAAVQLRAFAGTTPQSPLATPAPVPSRPAASVLGSVLDSAAYAGVIDFPDSLIAAADSLAANQLAEGAPAPSPAGQRGAAAATRRDATLPSQRTPGSRALQGPSRGSITPAPEGGLVPRLLRTTTHQSGDVYLVLREYDAASPAPGSRPGVNEYRWTNETLTRLFVLSGPVQVAELRAFARGLQGRPAP